MSRDNPHSSPKSVPAGTTRSAGRAGLRPKTPIDSVRYALDGVLLSFKTQRHLRIHFALALLSLLVGLVWQLSRVEIIILISAIALVILAELFNTALETVVDLITPDYHPLAKVAKDVSAGAVLVAAINAALVGVLLFLNPSRFHQQVRLPAPPKDDVQTFVIGLLLLFIILVIWKVAGEKGRFLRGGVVSGHASLAFFMATIILLFNQHPLVALMTVLLAALVAQSRVEAEIHSVREVVLGALLGILLPLLLFRILPAVVQHLPMAPLGPGS